MQVLISYRISSNRFMIIVRTQLAEIIVDGELNYAGTTTHDSACQKVYFST